MKAVNNLIDMCEGLSTADNNCSNSKLKSLMTNLKTQVVTEINNITANYQDKSKCNKNLIGKSKRIQMLLCKGYYGSSLDHAPN